MTTTHKAALAARSPIRAPRRWRYLPPNAPLAVAVVVGMAGTGYRLALLLAEVPATNSDEATMGLAALHIATGRHFPVFFYGQHYMGTIEAYLAAPLFALVGPSVLALRLPGLLLYLAFLMAAWLLARRLYTPWLATFTVALLALGSDRIVKNQLIAGGGYPEISPAGALLILLAVDLAAGTVRRRTLGYATVGLLAGFLVWDDWIILPYVAVAGVLLLAFRWSELRGRVLAVLGSTFLLGVAPLLGYHLAHRSNPFTTLLAVAEGGGTGGWTDRLHGGLLIGPSLGMGFCAPGYCALWQTWWSVAFPVLLVVAGVMAWRAMVRLTGPARVRETGRLGLVAAGAVTLLAYTSSGAAANTPVESVRYLSPLLITLPAVLWPLWRLATDRRIPAMAPARHRQLLRRAAALSLAAMLVSGLLATSALVARAPEISREADRRAKLVSTLRGLGATRLYSDYWTCNNITFAAEEEIVCAALKDDLTPGLDRYRPYRDLVAAAEQPAYVAKAGTPLSAAMAARIGYSGISRRVTVAGYEIYLPNHG